MERQYHREKSTQFLSSMMLCLDLIKVIILGKKVAVIFCPRQICCQQTMILLFVSIHSYCNVLISIVKLEMVQKRRF